MILQALALLVVAQAVPASGRPNVVFIYCDDLADWALGCYGNGQARTPNLDRLASQGARFSRAFVTTPVCSPSRAGLMTSRYATQVGIDDWIHPREEPDLGLSPSSLTWPGLLRARGYATGLFGKWHLGTRPHLHPTRQGYDHFFGFLDGSNRPIDPTLEVDGVVTPLEGSLPDLLVDDAIRFIKDRGDRPFLASVHFREPHTPYGPTPPEDSAPFEGLDPTIPDVPGLPVERVKRITREYYASVASIDRNVGRLLDALDELGVAEDTLVIFTSDHGYMIGHHGLHHKGNASWLVEGRQGHRPNMFDESIRVPLLVRWPGTVAPGTTVDRVVSNLDVFPTIAEAAGGVPANLRLEGRSIAPLLRDPEAAWDDILFGQYDMHHYRVARMRMIRTPEWKLVRHFEPGGEDELYHLAVDPGEATNLAADPSAQDDLARLDARLAAWMARIGDPLAEREP